MSIEGSADAQSFSLYLKEVLCPALKRGQILVMDNLSVHKSRSVRRLIEQKGCELWFMPAYSPDFNPIEEAFGKIKGMLRQAAARTKDALVDVLGEALSAISAQDAQGYFEHPGYRSQARLL